MLERPYAFKQWAEKYLDSIPGEQLQRGHACSRARVVAQRRQPEACECVHGLASNTSVQLGNFANCRSPPVPAENYIWMGEVRVVPCGLLAYLANRQSAGIPPGVWWQLHASPAATPPQHRHACRCLPAQRRELIADAAPTCHPACWLMQLPLPRACCSRTTCSCWPRRCGPPPSGE